MKLKEFNPSELGIDSTEIPGDLIKAYSLVDESVDPTWFMNSSYDLISAMVVLVDTIEEVDKIVNCFRDHFEEDIIKLLIDDDVTADHQEGVSSLLVHKCLEKYTVTFIYVYHIDYAIDTLNRAGIGYDNALYIIAGGEANDLSPVESLVEELWDSYEEPAVKKSNIDLEPAIVQFEELWKKWLDSQVPMDKRLSNWREESSTPWASCQFILEHGYFQ